MGLDGNLRAALLGIFGCNDGGKLAGRERGLNFVVGVEDRRC